MFFNFIPISHSIELFLWMLASFLVGYFFAMVFYKRGNIKTYSEDLNTHTTSDDFVKENQPEKAVIRARKTIERGGIEIKQQNKELRFDIIGIATEDEKDDLTKIKGIGAFIEEKLNAIGIFTYEQISRLSKNDIEAVTNLIEFFPGRIARDDWKGQSQNLLNSK